MILTYDKRCADLERVMRDLNSTDVRPIHPNYTPPISSSHMSSFAGLKMIPSPFVEPIHVADEIDEIPLSKHRSRRIFKKLCKRRRENARPKKVDMAYVFNGNMIVSPRVNDAIRQAFEIRIDV